MGRKLGFYHIAARKVKLQWKSVEMFCRRKAQKAIMFPDHAVK